MGDEEGIEDEELSEGLAKLLDKLGIRETAANDRKRAHVGGRRPRRLLRRDVAGVHRPT